MASLKQQGRRAFLWDFSGKAAINGSSFVVTIILARLLEPSDFGLIAIAMVMIGIAGVIKDSGLGSALIQRRRVLPIHYSSVFYFNMFVGMLLTVATYLSAGWISDFYDNHTDLLPVIEVMSLSFVISALSTVQSTQLRKELKFALLTKINFTASLTSGIIGISLAYSGAGVWSLVAQSLSMGLVYNLYIWSVGNWKPELAFSRKALMQLWGFGFRIFLTGLLDAVYARMDYLIIGKLFDPAMLGLYYRAKRLNLMATKFSSGSLMSVLFPVLSKIQRDLPRLQNVVIKFFGILSFAVFLLFGILYMVSDELIVILFSEKWLLSAGYFQLLALSGFAYPINSLLINVLGSRGKSKKLLRLAIIKKSVAFVNLGVGFMFGIEGFLYGLVIVALINTSMTIFAAAREISLAPLRFHKLLFVPMMIGVVSIVSAEWVCGNMEGTLLLLLVIKSAIYSFLYIMLNQLFRTEPLQYFNSQFLPFAKKLADKRLPMLFDRKKTKVFCIGQNKTGTTSVEAVLKSLGYRMGNQIKGELLLDEWAKRDFRNIVKLCKTADAFQDIPFSNDYTYEVLDYVFPNSKFILTVRNSKDEWYESLIHFHTKVIGKGRLPTAEDLKAHIYREKGYLWKAQKFKYGADENTVYDYKLYTDQYEKHNARVREFFKYRPDDLLILNLSDEDAMAKLYAFLGVEYHDEQMPHLNKSKDVAPGQDVC